MYRMWKFKESRVLLPRLTDAESGKSNQIQNADIMKTYGLIALVVLGLLSGQHTIAQETNRHVVLPQSTSGDRDDGLPGAQLGTIIFNAYNPDNPLPMPQRDGAVIENTFHNIGAGLPPVEAFGKAAIDASGVDELKPRQSRPIPNGGKTGGSRLIPNLDISSGAKH